MGWVQYLGLFTGDEMEDLVSIIVPVYKTEKYLRRCVNSILRQTYKYLEIILVDDGSPDSCGELCDELSCIDNRILVIHKQNGGLSSARNAGIEAAKGDYICFIDSDDYVEVDYTSTLHRLIKDYDADLAKINYIEVNTDDYTEIPSNVDVTVYQEKEVEKAFLALRVDSACVFMYKRSLIGATRFPEGKTSEDIPFNFALFQKATRFVYLPQNKYYYWHNPDSISNGPLDKNYLNYLFFRREIYEHYQKENDNELRRLAEVLYARAAMGIMARMALFGLTSEMNEKQLKRVIKAEFSRHANAFFRDKGTEISRKILAVLVFHFYSVAKLLGRIIKKG